MRAAKLLALVPLALAALATPAPASAKPVLAVLYFDNNTGDQSYDVLQKGFADMLITDLSSSSDVVVVERDRLQDLLGELKLQRGRYFDKKTAVRIGKGLGARYAVAGSFVAVEPKVRINTRLIEVSSGKIIFGTSVVGTPGKIFDLEQELVGKFLAGLKLSFDASGRKQTRVPDLGTVIEYSKGIDLADRGDLERAKQQLSTVVSAAPTFALARVRRAELIKRWEEIKANRADKAVLARAELAKRAESFLRKSFIDLDQEEADQYLGYRELRGELLLWALSDSLTISDHLKLFPRERAKQQRAQDLARAYYDNMLQMFREHKAFVTRFTKSHSGTVQPPYASLRLPPVDQRLLMEAKVHAPRHRSAQGVLDNLVHFALMGQASQNVDRPSGSSSMFYYAPPLGSTDAKRRAELLRILEGEWRLADKQTKKPGASLHDAVRLLDTWANYYFVIGDFESGIKKLQEIVDRYPGAPGNDYRERRIEEELGMRSSNEQRQRERYTKGLRDRCADTMDINVGMRHVMYLRQRQKGFAGLLDVVKEIERACSGNPKARHLMSMVYSTVANIAAENGFCDEFERWMKRSMEQGRPASEVAAFRSRSVCAHGK